MPGLVPGTHAAPFFKIFKAGCGGAAWMAGTSPAMTTWGRPIYPMSADFLVYSGGRC
jgi:hypothetical protein